MSILSGFFKTKKLRRMADGNYKLQSEWTSSETVEMADGNTVEENLGSIKGITSSLASTDSGYALAADAGKNLQDQVNGLNSNLQNKANTSTVTSLQTSVNTINTKLTAGYVAGTAEFKYKAAWDSVNTGTHKLMYIISDGGTEPIIVPCNISIASPASPVIMKNASGSAIFQYYVSGKTLYVYVLNSANKVGVNYIL